MREYDILLMSGFVIITLFVVGQWKTNNWRKQMKLNPQNSMMERIIKPILDRARVNIVFGEPQHQSQKTVIPVGRVLVMTGGGLGIGLDENEQQNEGGGGGLFLSAKPIGALEITDTDTRFIRLNSWKNKILPFGLGVLFAGIVLKWLTSKK